MNRILFCNELALGFTHFPRIFFVTDFYYTFEHLIYSPQRPARTKRQSKDKPMPSNPYYLLEAAGCTGGGRPDDTILVNSRTAVANSPTVPSSHCMASHQPPPVHPLVPPPTPSPQILKKPKQKTKRT